MTTQLPDKISIEGQAPRDLLPYGFMKTPLWPALEADPELFRRLMTASPATGATNLHRKYVAHWAITRAILYLHKIEVPGPSGAFVELSIQDLFPDAKDQVMADWFTGPLLIVDAEEGGANNPLAPASLIVVHVEAGVAKSVGIQKAGAGTRH